MAAPESPSGAFVQGTRVATPEQGTIGGPKQQPTVTATGGAGETPNTEGLPRLFPPNPASVIVSGPGTRESNLRTDANLQTAPPPQRIIRQLFSRIFGKISEDGQHGFPYNAEWSLLPHQFVPRNAQGTGPMARQYDNTAIIPAVYAGNVRKGG